MTNAARRAILAAAIATAPAWAGTAWGQAAPAPATPTSTAPAATPALASVRPKMPIKECAASCAIDLKKGDAERRAMDAAHKASDNICMMSCFARLLPDGDPRKKMLGNIAQSTYEHAKAQNLDVRPPQR